MPAKYVRFFCFLAVPPLLMKFRNEILSGYESYLLIVRFAEFYFIKKYKLHKNEYFFYVYFFACSISTFMQKCKQKTAKIINRMQNLFGKKAPRDLFFRNCYILTFYVKKDRHAIKGGVRILPKKNNVWDCQILLSLFHHFFQKFSINHLHLETFSKIVENIHIFPK